MDYFLLRQSGTVCIPKALNYNRDESEAEKSEASSSQEPSVRIMEDISSLDKFDYIACEHLVSDPLKQILEQYLPEQAWRPCVFVDPPRREQTTFWFLPALSYLPEQAAAASNGIPAAVYIKEEDFAGKSPGIFRIRSPKGSVFIVVHLSVAESILRRGICGLELVRLSDTAAGI